VRLGPGVKSVFISLLGDGSDVVGAAIVGAAVVGAAVVVEPLKRDGDVVEEVVGMGPGVVVGAAVVVVESAVLLPMPPIADMTSGKSSNVAPPG